MPHFLFISNPNLSIESSSLRSNGTIVDFEPILIISSYCSSSAPTVRATNIISKPFFANSIDKYFPNPLDEPVTRAILSL